MKYLIPLLLLSSCGAQLPDANQYLQLGKKPQEMYVMISECSLDWNRKCTCTNATEEWPAASGIFQKVYRCNLE